MFQLSFSFIELCSVIYKLVSICVLCIVYVLMLRLFFTFVVRTWNKPLTPLNIHWKLKRTQSFFLIYCFQYSYDHHSNKIRSKTIDQKKIWAYTHRPSLYQQLYTLEYIKTDRFFLYGSVTFHTQTPSSNLWALQCEWL